jgi:hypothetical protein
MLFPMRTVVVVVVVVSSDSDRPGRGSNAIVCAPSLFDSVSQGDQQHRDRAPSNWRKAAWERKGVD